MAIILTLLAVGIVIFLFWSVSWCRIPYEGNENEIITKTWGKDDKRVNKYVPLYKNWWGKIYYGEFSKDFFGDWKQTKYVNGFWGDPNLFTTRKIYHHYLYREDWIGRQIKKDEEIAEEAENKLNAAELKAQQTIDK